MDDNDKSRVLLITPPYVNDLRFGKDWQRAESANPPLGLMYLADTLINNGHDVSFIDFNVDKYEYDDFVALVKEKDFALITTFTMALRNVKKLIRIIKESNPNIFVICGGPHCNLSRALVDGSDMSVVGEAEEVIAELVKRITLNKPVDDIPGLIYPKDGKVVHNEGVLFVKDLNKSKHASHKLARGKDYGDFCGVRLKNFAGIMSSRGCPFRCRYCTYKGVSPYRERSPENVVDELVQLERAGAGIVAFYDDNFLLNKRRAHAIMDLIMEKRLRLKIFIQARVDSADPDLYQKLRNAGVVGIAYGVESGNQDVLDFYQKDVNVKKIEEAITLADRVGMITHGNFMIGAPIEDETHFKINKEFLDRVPMDWISVNVLCYLKGTPLWESAFNAGLIKENQIVVQANEKLSKYTYAQWLDMKDKLVDGFYAKPTRVLRLIYKAVRLGMFDIGLKFLFRHFKKVPFLPIEEPVIEI